MSSSIQEIVRKLREASDAYYNGGQAIMGDDAFDDLKEELRTLDPSNPFLIEVGAKVAEGAVKLPYLMPSLDKIKPGEDTLRRFLAASQQYVVSEKLDGLSALWSPAKKSLYLRGDGIEGQDISHLVPLGIQGLKTAGKAKFLIVRGEILVSRSEVMKGPARSWVNGLIHQKTPTTAEVSKLRFVAYEVLFPSRQTRSQQFALLREAGYELPWSQTVSGGLTEEMLSTWLVQRREASGYDTDGIVVAYDGIPIEQMAVLKNPKNCVAFKMPLADQKATTRVIAVEWNPSAQGYLIPRIQFEPVVIGGATIQYCTGHNAKTIQSGRIGPGAIICIRRSGDVIPTLDSVLTPAAQASMPTDAAAVWDGDAHMRISAGTTSKEIQISQLGHFLKTLDIPNAGPATAKTLVDGGIDTPKKLWSTTAARLSELLGPKSGAALFTELRAAFTRLRSEQILMIASSQMPRGVGETKLKALFEVQADPRLWSTLQTPPAGWTAETLRAFQARYPAYETWRKEMDWIAYPILTTPAVAAATKRADALAICFTGFRDKDLETRLVAAGHIIHAAVSGKTNVLVVSDDASETEKVKKARAMGIRIVKRSDANTLN